MGILDEILIELKELKKDDFFKYNIKEIFLKVPYTIVELENGAQGIAANYDYLDQKRFNYVLDKLPENERLLLNLQKKLKEDILLYQTILTKDLNDNLTLQSLRTAILSALSRGTDDYIKARGIKIEKGASFNLDALSGANDSIAFIGFSGNITYALESENFKNIFVSDYIYTAKKLKMTKYMKIAFPKKNISFVDPTHNDFILEQSNIAWITASAICNNTMDRLIASSKKCREVILQGATGAIFPLPFFKRNVKRILCPNIDIDFLSSTKKFMEGKQLAEYFKEFCTFMDNSLKSIYIHA